ncbi:hypothetical protein GN956_G19286 [Arapaima gigas]
MLRWTLHGKDESLWSGNFCFPENCAGEHEGIKTAALSLYGIVMQPGLLENNRSALDIAADAMASLSAM